MKQKRPFRWGRFGKHLKAHRVRLGLGLREAARLTKTHHATFCRAEQGKAIEVSDFVFLCRWINRNPDAFLVIRHVD